MIDAPTQPEIAPRHDRTVLYVLLGLFGLFGAVLVVDALVTGWLPIHDYAAWELRTRDLLSSNTPLIGSHGRYGWSSPGPALIWALAPGYWLTGGSSDGLLAAAVVTNVAAVAGCLLMARRRGGLLLLGWTALLLAVLVHGLGAQLFQSPWNPWVTVLPFVAFVFVCWSASLGERWAVPAALVLGTFLVQGHVAYLPMVLVSGAWLVGWRILAWRRDDAAADERRDRARRELRLWLVSLAAVSVLWIPTVLDQLAGTQNLSAMFDFFTTSQLDTTGPREGAGLGAAAWSPFGHWFTGSISLRPFSPEVDVASLWWLALPAAGLVGAALVARRWGPKGSIELLGLGALLGAAGLISLSNITGPVVDYLLTWTRGVAFVIWLAIGWPLLAAARRLAADRGIRWLPATATVGSVVAVAALLVSTPDLLDTDGPQAELGDVVEALAPGTEAAVADVEGPVLIRPVDPPSVVFPAPSSRSYTAGLALQLERAGTPFRVLDDDWQAEVGLGGARLFTEHREGADGVAGTLLVVNSAAVDTFEAPPGAFEVARVGPAEPPDLAAMEADAEASLREAGFDDVADHVSGPELGWLAFGLPEDSAVRHEVSELLTAREAVRVVVLWVPDEAYVEPLVAADVDPSVSGSG